MRSMHGSTASEFYDKIWIRVSEPSQLATLGVKTYGQKDDCNDDNKDNYETRCASPSFPLILGCGRKLLGCPLGIYSDGIHV